MSNNLKTIAERFGNNTMAITVNKVQEYMKNDLNVLISGQAGTGKTEIVLKAAENLGLKVKYYSASTLDPYTDLIGIPVPQNETRTVDFYRPKEIDEADVVFFDEMNRADDKVLNTIFELIQFRSINGEKLPKLRCAISAINPNDGNYTVEDLDMALVDRFDTYLQSEPNIDLPYFKAKFGKDMAMAVQKWWNDYERNRTNSSRSSKNPMGYISPRRMDKICSTFLKIPAQTTVAETLPPDVNTSVKELYRVLNNARMGNKKKATTSTTAKKKVSSGGSSSNSVQRIIDMGSTIRHSNNHKKLNNVLRDTNISYGEKKKLVSFAATHMSNNIGAENIIKKWSDVLELMTSSDVKTMVSNWSIQKKSAFAHAVRRDTINNKNTILNGIHS